MVNVTIYSSTMDPMAMAIVMRGFGCYNHFFKKSKRELV